MCYRGERQGSCPRRAARSLLLPVTGGQVIGEPFAAAPRRSARRWLAVAGTSAARHAAQACRDGPNEPRVIAVLLPEFRGRGRSNGRGMKLVAAGERPRVRLAETSSLGDLQQVPTGQDLRVASRRLPVRANPPGLPRRSRAVRDDGGIVAGTVARPATLKAGLVGTRTERSYLPLPPGHAWGQSCSSLCLLGGRG